MIWPMLVPWFAMACALYGVWQREPIWLLWAIFMLVGAIYWKINGP